MNIQELEVAHRIALLFEEATEGSDRARAVAVFGPERARRYEALQRQAHSSLDFEKADRAGDEIAAMEDSLTEQQQRRLFGIGELNVITPEVVRAYQEELAGLDCHSPQSLGHSLTSALLRLTSAPTNPLQMSFTQQLAFARVRAALEYASERGWSRAIVLRAANSGIRELYQDQEDAELMSRPISMALAQATADAGAER